MTLDESTVSRSWRSCLRLRRVASWMCLRARSKFHAFVSGGAPGALYPSGYWDRRGIERRLLRGR